MGGLWYIYLPRWFSHLFPCNTTSRGVIYQERETQTNYKEKKDRIPQTPPHMQNHVPPVVTVFYTDIYLVANTLCHSTPRPNLMWKPAHLPRPALRRSWAPQSVAHHGLCRVPRVIRRRGAVAIRVLPAPLSRRAVGFLVHRRQGLPLSVILGRRGCHFDIVLVVVGRRVARDAGGRAGVRLRVSDQADSLFDRVAVHRLLA